MNLLFIIEHIQSNKVLEWYRGTKFTVSSTCQ